MNVYKFRLGPTQAFNASNIDDIASVLNVNCVVLVLNNRMIIWEADTKLADEELYTLLSKYIINKSSSHYAWLDENLEDFWQKVFGKTLSESNCGGIISAHGDKAYGYKRKWEEYNIPFNHGVAMFLLTYTDIIDDSEQNSSQWVIDNYEKYKPLLNEDY